MRSHQFVIRSRIILACAEGKAGGDVAKEVGVTQQTVSKWRKRFAEGSASRPTFEILTLALNELDLRGRAATS
jgi:transposase-like protein